MKKLIHSINTILYLLSFSVLVFIIIAFTPSQSVSYISRSNHITGSEKIAAIQDIILRDATIDAGLFATHQQGATYLTGINETLGAGVCAFDYDNDGWIDLFIIGGTGRNRYYGRQSWWQKQHGNRLYRNTGNNKFIETTVKAGLESNAWGMGCVSGDLDNDGDTDLLITNYGQNSLYRNNGDATFTDITQQSGLTGQYWSTSAALADYDGDGLLDIYIVNYIDYIKGSRTYESLSSFKNILPIDFNPALYNGQPNQLYRNNGGLHFTENAKIIGVDNSGGRGLAALWLDINDDSRPDLIVSNDAGVPNTVYLNRDGKRFTDVTDIYGLNITKRTTGITQGDIDNDGDIDLGIGTFSDVHTLIYLNKTNDKLKGHPANKIKPFDESSRTIGIGGEQNAGLFDWSLAFVDLNNDGWQDLISTHGFLTPDPDNPRITQGQVKRVWINSGQGQFIPITDSLKSPLNDSLSSRGIALADFDNDGDMDIYFSHNNDLGQLLVNDTPQKHWLGIRLIGAGNSHKDALGAKILVRQEHHSQLRELTSGPGVFSDSDKRVLFSLGDDTTNIKVIVRWPDGEKETFNNPPIDQYITVTQGQSEPVRIPALKQAPETILNTDAPDIELPDNYSDFLVLLSETFPPENIIPELTLALKNQNPVVQQAAFDILSKNKTLVTIQLLTYTLDTSSSETQIKALTTLADYEDEMTVRWLLRAFRDDSPVLRCAAANIFSGFFREEEAVIARKYLAIPHLIKLLDDEKPEVRRCAATALGEAERYQAHQPLVLHLDDADTRTRKEAIKSLGLIREKAATPYLLALLDDRSLPVDMMAETLIALQRLGYEKIDSLLDSFLSNQNEETRILRSLETLLTIINTGDDHSVISKKVIATHIQTWMAGPGQKYFRRQQQGNGLIPDKASEILFSAGDPAALKIDRLLKVHKNEQIRANAYERIVTGQTPITTRILKDVLHDKSVLVKNRVLEALLKIDTLPDLSAIKDTISDVSIQKPLIRLLSRQPDNGVIRAIEQVLMASDTDMDVIMTAIKAASENNLAFADVEYFLNHPDEHIRAASLGYWSAIINRGVFMADIPPVIKNGLNDKNNLVRLAAIDVLLSRKEPWALKVLYDYVRDTSADISKRQRVLDTILNKRRNNSEKLLSLIARNSKDPLAAVAVRHLDPTSSASIQSYLWSVLDNNTMSLDIRFAAAYALLSTDKNRVLATTRALSLPPDNTLTAALTH